MLRNVVIDIWIVFETTFTLAVLYKFFVQGILGSLRYLLDIGNSGVWRLSPLERSRRQQKNAMKISSSCQKCQSSKIVRIPGEIRAFGAGNNITVGTTIFSAVKVTRFLCTECGFSEEWVESASDLAKIQKKYAFS